MRREIIISRLLSGTIILFLFILSACQSSEKAAENKKIVVTASDTPLNETADLPQNRAVADNGNINAEIAKPSPTVKENASAQTSVENHLIDIAELANRSPGEIDNILGQAIETKGISIPKTGVYRVYKIAGEPKGLAIRFYGGRAKNFNLILSQPVASARVALKKTFAIDIGNISPVKDAKEPLSEKWSGEFGGVKFSNIYAKRENANGGFVFVLAEIAD